MAQKKAQPKKATPKKSSAPMISGPTKAQEQKWQAEDDIRTIQRHAELMADKARLARAAELAKKNAQEASQAAKKIGGMAGKK